MIVAFTALYDACVLYPAPIRDVLMHLALADIYLGDFRDSMTRAGLWDKTTVLVTSDHPNRLSMEIDGKQDPRVPFLLKMAGQSGGVDYDTVLRTIVTKPLIEAILARRITTSADAIKWLMNPPADARSYNPVP